MTPSEPLARRLFRDPIRLGRIPELDGLRALLAWWVVLYHARGANFSMAFEISEGPLAWISHGSMAVDVFMILSGFVIFFLLDREHEGYRPFIVRRFLRLFPVYALCFVAMLALQGAYIGNLHANAPRLDPALFDEMLLDAEQPIRDLPAQLAVHAVMAHGVMPSSLLRNAAGAFLVPAWSISLEWQFYLVAPFVFLLLRRWHAAGAAIWLAVTAVVLVTRGAWPPFSFDAFLALHLHTFTAGIASYYVYKAAVASERAPALLRFAPLAVGLGVAVGVLVQCVRLGPLRGTTPGWWFPFAIWAFSFAVLLARSAGGGGRFARAYWRLLAYKPLERLGTVSYSTYLAHWPVLVVCQALYRSVLDDPTPAQLFALHLAISFPLVAAASFALYRFVEAPGIALGRRLTRGKRL